MSESTSQTDVLVVGAGPTGLVLSLLLARLGIKVRVIDKTAEPGTTSRALAVQARILEHYDQFGLADTVVNDGLEMIGANLWVAGRKVARAPIGEMGKDMSPFPFVVIYPQDEHERFLIEQLRAEGVHVERRTSLVHFEATGDHVNAQLESADGGAQHCAAAYIAGCDGAHSRVRELLGTGFPGGTYSHLFYVADVEASGPMMDRELHVALDASDFLALFPLASEGRARLIGTVRHDAAHGRELGWDDVSKSILHRMRLAVAKVNWFSTYRVHHRVARQFHRGRAFLLGDAAHIHSPVGGQGMNTGIGDAVNLSWKLAAVVRGVAERRLLDSYEPERMKFAKRLVNTTDRAFTFITRDGSLARFVRLHVAPHVIRRAFTAPALRRFMFRTVSQTVIDYRDCPLSQGVAGQVRGGDRMPWVRSNGEASDDNFAPLKAFDWQVHVYGEASARIVEVCNKRGLRFSAFRWRAEMKEAGLEQNALYLLRPDGYVALAAADPTGRALETYLNESPIGYFRASSVP